MPTISCDSKYLFKLIGKEFTEKEFDEVCFQYGIELDDVVEEEGKTIYKIEVGANRYDLLCVEGIAICLKTFLKMREFPKYTVKSSGIQIHVGKDVEKVRPICMGAVLRGITFTEESYKSFIDFQDKLHLTIGKKRSLVAIGTHDLSTLVPPFRYVAMKPEEIKFEPLKCDHEMTGNEVIEHFSNDLKLKEYVPLLQGKEVYPVFLDSKNIVLSLPPLINGNHSKITLNTHDVFIDITGMDKTKVMMALQTVVTCFSLYTSTPFEIETVEVVGGPVNEFDDKKSIHTPILEEQHMKVSKDYLNQSLGLELKDEEITELLHKMGIQYSNGEAIIPPMRTDVMHPCDIMEDLAISYGFNNLHASNTISRTCGKELLQNKLKDLLADEIAYAGYTEVITFVLMSVADAATNLRRPEEGLIKLKDSKTLEFQTARKSLLSGMMKCLYYNKAYPMPIRMFEVGDTVSLKEGSLTGAVNRQQVCALVCSPTGLMEEIHGLLDKIMFCYGVGYKKARKENGPHYDIVPGNDPAYMEGRRADIMINGVKYGMFGVLHPEVLKNFEVDNPVVALELYLDFPNGI
ncbi:phenylalanine--tRNA ligase, beta subunit protein [Entamoeba nuttalli P19]|uniref:phenylalanine--tRNA ligase n=1 Tax=Entamoeba nuttalli (strain P19) TaxID=1076696 RepID=K2H3S5_ENTNP|nr:phenylalanine--tRNA ligase, beta subunit protein [Entamoeba nuttalli P19]EKE41007.1 phenylalanine--tRNA ligase, beta subunit protein [Entamoeba nuttalli P19]|eukprot:XP_008856660.1 phenylalanine--tRNA ligase, beta subunit protein [Entamoeba nuttalli P19]